MDPEEYEQYLAIQAINSIQMTKESEKKKNKKDVIYIVIEGSDLFCLEKDKLSDNMVKRLVITKDKLSTVLKMCHNSSGHQGVNKTVYYIMILFKQFYWLSWCHLTFRKI